MKGKFGRQQWNAEVVISLLTNRLVWLVQLSAWLYACFAILLWMQYFWIWSEVSIIAEKGMSLLQGLLKCVLFLRLHLRCAGISAGSVNYAVIAVLVVMWMQDFSIYLPKYVLTSLELGCYYILHVYNSSREYLCVHRILFLWGWSHEIITERVPAYALMLVFFLGAGLGIWVKNKGG